MIIDVTNEIYTRLKNSINNCTILASYPDIAPSFPCIIIEEGSNTVLQETIDSGGQHHSEVLLELNIFSNSQAKITEVKSLRNQIDAILGDEYGMSRIFSGAIPNLADTTIYRYVMRYSFIINVNKEIYRR